MFPYTIFRKICRFSVILFLLLTVSVALVSCGPGEKDETVLRIGLMEEPRTLNIWLASDANSRKVISLIYQPLYTYDPDTLDLAPWLAESLPEYDSETESYTVRLREANWSDGTPVTADDVVYTVDLIKEFQVPRYYSQWEFVENVVAVDERTVRFYLEDPRAIFLTRTLVNYIIPRSQWEPIAEDAQKKENPLVALMNARIANPLGSGPFVLKQWREGAYIHLEKNEHFFGSGLTISGRTLGPHVDSLLFRVYGTADVAVLAMKNETIDFLWWSIQPGYIDDLEREENVEVFLSDRSALYYFGFNVRREPFSDAAFRQATHTLIDKDFIIDRVLQGYASRMDSIVPAENRFWYADDLPEYARGLSREDRIRKAHGLLLDNGYTWERPPVSRDGNVVSPSRIILPDGNPMNDFTILTPPADYDPARATIGVIIQEWLKDVGIPASSRPMSFGALLQRIKDRHDFESFVMGYGQLAMDPDYLRSFFHSDNDRPGGWNMSGYNNPEFDRLADASVSAMEPRDRQALIREMQHVVMTDVPYIPLYNPMAIEPVGTRHFSGWEQMIDGIGNLWSICMVAPVNQ